MTRETIMRFSLTLLSAFFFCSPLLYAAGGEEVAKFTYEDHVKPILRESCFSCHNQNEKKGGLALDTYGSTIEGGAGGEVVFDGDSGSSRLWQLMAHEDTPVMPPGQDKLADAKVDTVRDWINGGLLENSGSKAKKKKANTLAFSASLDGRPEGPAPMPESAWKQPVVVTERAAAATAIRSSPWAPLIAIAGQNQVVLYNTDTAELAGILPFPEGEPQALSFTRDGRYLLVGGGRHSSQGMTILYDIKTGDRVGRCGDELDIVMGSDINDTVSKVALGGPKRMLRIHDLASGDVLFELKKHTDWVYSVRYSPDGILVASGDRAGGLVLWESGTGRLYLDLVGHKDAIRGITWRADSNVVASASMDGTVKLWEIANGTQIKSFNAHGGGVTGIDMARDGRLVTCGKDRLVKLWDANGNHVRDFPAMPEAVLEVSFSHDGGKVIAGDWSGQVQMWNTDDPTISTILKANPETIETRLATTKTAAEQATATWQQNATALAALDQELTAIGESLAVVNQQLATNNESLPVAEASVQAAKLLAEQTVAELQSLSASEPELTNRIAAINASIGESSQQGETLRAGIAAAEITAAESTSVRDQTAAEIGQFDKQLADANADGSATPELLASIKQKRDAAIENHRASKESLDSALEKVSTMSRELNTHLTTLQPSFEERQTVQTQISDLQTKLAAARQAQDGANQALKVAEQQLAGTKAMVGEFSAKKTDMESKLAELTAKRSEVEPLVQQTASSRDTLVAAASQLEQDLAAFQGAAQQLAATEAELQATIDANRAEADAKLAESETLQTTLAGEDEKLAAVQAQLAALQAQVEQLRATKREIETAQANAVVTLEEAEIAKQRVSDRKALYEAAYKP